MYRYLVRSIAGGNPLPNHRAEVHTIFMEDGEMTAKTGQTVTIMARIFDLTDSTSYLLNTGSNIASVKYTCYKVANDASMTPVTGHSDANANTNCVLSSLAPPDDAWTFDNVGYTFSLTPDITTNELFPDPGRYAIKTVVSVEDSNPITIWDSFDVE